MCFVSWLEFYGLLVVCVGCIVGVSLYPWSDLPALVLFCFCLGMTVRVYSFRFHVFSFAVLFGLREIGICFCFPRCFSCCVFVGLGFVYV